MRGKAFSAYSFALTGAALWLLAGLLLLLPAGPTAAQCGGTGSSCKTCHEINGEFSVNDSGVWHTDHMLTDACAACHQGDKTQAGVEAAHSGMVAPLADPATNCGSCHQDNYEALAVAYAELAGPNTSSPQSLAPDPLDAPATASDPLDAPAAAAVADTPAEAVAADTSTNTAEERANRVLVVLAEALAVVGIGTVWYFERRV